MIIRVYKIDWKEKKLVFTGNAIDTGKTELIKLNEEQKDFSFSEAKDLNKNFKFEFKNTTGFTGKIVSCYVFLNEEYEITVKGIKEAILLWHIPNFDKSCEEIIKKLMAEHLTDIIKQEKLKK